MHASSVRQTVLNGPSVLQLALFTRANCSLCSNARSAIHKTRKIRNFHYLEVDIMRSDYKEWRDLYEFDVPVVSRLYNPVPLSLCKSMPALNYALLVIGSF